VAATRPELPGADALVFRLPVRRSATRLASALAGAGYSLIGASAFRRDDRYLDTQDGRLHRAGLRLRRRNDGPVWQLVGRGWVVAEEAAGGEEAPEGADVGTAVAAAAGGCRLLPQATVHATGKCLRLQTPVGAAVELEVARWTFVAPDGGPNVAGPRVAVLERPSALPAEAQHLAAVLRDLLRLRRLETDALAAGLAALALPLPGAPVPPELRLDTADTVAVAAHKILARQAFKMWANTAGTIADLDPEFLHDLRVATRRARSGLRLLAPLYGGERCEALRAELGWVAAALGAVRDVDVHRERIRAELERAGAAPGDDAGLAAALDHRRGPALAALRAALRSARFTDLVAALRAMEVGSDAAPEAVAWGAAPAVEVAPEFIARAARRVRRWGDQIGDATSNTELHRLRILFKRLRYTAEFFAELFGEPMRVAIARLVPFQDCLGALQDAVVGLATLTDHAAARTEHGRLRPQELLTLGALMQVQREEIARQRAALAQLWSKLPGVLRALKRACGPTPAAQAGAG
jgi:CHAD domain-containing protein